MIFHYGIFKNNQAQTYFQQLKRNIFGVDWPSIFNSTNSCKSTGKSFCETRKIQSSLLFFDGFPAYWSLHSKHGKLDSNWLRASKKSYVVRIQKEAHFKRKMYYKEGWGWVDKVHYRDDHFKEIYESIKAGKKTIKLHDGWVTPLRFPVSFSVNYLIGEAKNEIEQWVIATAITTHFMEENERVQANSPWYHGNQLSAWQFDDVTVVY